MSFKNLITIHTKMQIHYLAWEDKLTFLKQGQ